MKKKTLSGGARLKADGKHAMLLGWLSEYREKIQAAAALDGRNLSQFVYVHALKAAEKILEKSAKRT